MDMNRRQFLRVSGAGLVGSSLVALGFSPTAALAETRNFKLARTTETRSTCPYCSVSCGMILYTLGDKAKNVKSTIVHVEGDPDHPVNRWNTTGFLMSSASSNESGYLSVKVARGLGMVAIDTQARI